jgi:hypothetical protein
MSPRLVDGFQEGTLPSFAKGGKWFAVQVGCNTGNSIQALRAWRRPPAPLVTLPVACSGVPFNPENVPLGAPS